MTCANSYGGNVKIKPLRKGRISIADQARARRVDVPVNVTVGELKMRGFDCDPDWDDAWLHQCNADSPTGYVVTNPFNENIAIYALAV